VEFGLKIQEKSVVDHNDFFDWNTLGGGYMNLVMPRDAPTVVIN